MTSKEFRPISNPASSAAITRKVGKLTITRITETEIAGISPAGLFPDLAGLPEVVDLFPAHMLDAAGNVRLAVHSWLVRGPQGTWIIDTGIGNGKQRMLAPHFHDLQTDFLDRLAAEGVSPEDIDHVLLTHLHVDHVGWNTNTCEGVWLPTFLNARYIFTQAEYRFFGDPVNFSDRNRNSFLARQDSIDPVVANGQAVMIEADGRDVLSGVRFVSTPGHSPFHCSIVVESAGETAVFAGDTLHHVAQVVRPEVNSIFDFDPEQARASRTKVLEVASAERTLLFGGHISGGSVLNVSRGESGGYLWEEA